ncbi:MAG: acVLRF1 family peptidyl-tRNA hydrolase [Actinomycetes bacterium]
MSGRPAAGGGRWVDVAPERLERWLAGFAQRHGDVTCAPGAGTVAVTAADGALAEVAVPFPPLAVDTAAPWGGLVEHVLEVRTVGVLLVRLGGHAAGVFRGDQLLASKVGSRHVQGRSAAGGWSQQRFARRREGQAKVALSAATEVAVEVLLPAAASLQALVLGGDRRSAAAVLEDPRLTRLRALVVEPHLDVPDPRRRVLEQTPALFRAVHIRIVEP